jgi:hypothetical protein
MTRAILVGVILGSVLLSQGFGQSEIIVLEPSAAATIEGEINGPSEESIEESRVLLKFDFSSLPEGAKIQFAGLMLSDETGLPWDVPHVPVLVGALTEDWDESSASWDGPSNGESWDNPGGDWGPALTSYRVLVLGARAPGKIVITDIVRKWLNEERENYGLIAMVLEPEEVTDMLPSFTASTLEPSLQIRYFLPEEGTEAETEE